VVADVLEYLLVQLRLLQLEDVLHQVVTIGVFDKVANLGDNLPCEFDLLVHAAFLEASLHNTAAMLLLAYEDTVIDTGIKDELSVSASFKRSSQVRICGFFRSTESRQESLNNVISMGVHRQFYNPFRHNFSQLLELLVVCILAKS